MSDLMQTSPLDVFGQFLERKPEIPIGSFCRKQFCFLGYHLMLELLPDALPNGRRPGLPDRYVWEDFMKALVIATGAFGLLAASYFGLVFLVRQTFKQIAGDNLAELKP